MSDITGQIGKRVLVIGSGNSRTGRLLFDLRDMGIDCAAIETTSEYAAFMSHLRMSNTRIDAIVAEQTVYQAAALNEYAELTGVENIPVLLFSDEACEKPDGAEPYIHAKSSGVLSAVADLLRLYAGPATKIPTMPITGQGNFAANSSADILVAEDNDINQLVISQYLDTTPYTYKIVSNGRRAVHAFRNINPRLILMDVSMPEMNGKEATAAIRALEGQKAARVPIIALTAHALKGDREDCLRAGMDDYISKPIDFSLLGDILSRNLGCVSGKAVNAA